MQYLSTQDISDTQTASIIDVRTPDEFAQASIPGSRNLPLAQLANASHLLPSNAPIILSCRTGRRAVEAYQILSQQGLQNLSILQGGIEAWKQAGRPVNRSNRHRLSIMQQVQIIAGSLILLGSLNKTLWFLAPLVGFGLLVAGLSNTCLMATLLSKMPWNRITAPSNQCSL